MKKIALHNLGCKVNSYEIEKNGTANIGVYKESNINLITCIDGTNKQLVIAGIIMEDE